VRTFIRNTTPGFILNCYRFFKKRRKNKQLLINAKDGKGFSKQDIIEDLLKIGIHKGDVLMVHSSLSKIGYVQEGAKSLVEALIEVIGTDGHLLMPNSPNDSFQLEYIQSIDEFDVLNSPSKLGAISEYFRKFPGVKRSAHPTEPVSCWGPDKAFFVDSHFGNLTPYDQNSPFYKVIEKRGKILYLGVTLDNAGTHLHTLEDAIPNFKYPVYCDELFEVKVRMEDGSIHYMKTKVHNPEQSKKRKCDGLIPLFESEGVLSQVTVGNAKSLILDAHGMFECMQKHYYDNGVTMYTPKGS
jgi:aminoglycoside 3-N-acetyltransferase